MKAFGGLRFALNPPYASYASYYASYASYGVCDLRSHKSRNRSEPSMCR
jgi:hypothetical protein